MIKKLISIFIVFIFLGSFSFAEGNVTFIDNSKQNNSNLSSSSTVVYQCSDGIDNDGDGLIDYDGHGDLNKKDPGCIGPVGNDESSDIKSKSSSNSNTNNTTVSSDSGSDIPWSMIIGLGAPALFLVSGLAKDNKGAAQLGQDRLQGVAQSQLVGVVGPPADQVLQGLTFVSNPAGAAEGLAIQGIKKEVMDAAVAKVPKLGPVLQTKQELDQMYKDGRILLENGQEKSNIEITSENEIASFKDIEFKGKENTAVDASKMILDSDSIKDEASVKVKGFKALKEKGVTTLVVSEENQVLETGGSKARSEKPTNFKGMAKGSIVKLNSKGEVLEADITVGADSGTYVLGDKKYSLPKGAKISYNKEKGTAKITEFSQAKLNFGDGKGNFGDVSTDINFVSVPGKVPDPLGDHIEINGRNVKGTGSYQVMLNGGDETIEVDSEGIKDRIFDLEFDAKDRGVFVNRGHLVREGLDFRVNTDSEGFLSVNNNINLKDLKDYDKSWVFKDDKDMKAVSVEGKSVNVGVLKEDKLFKNKENELVPLSFKITDGAELVANRQTGSSLANLEVLGKKGAVTIFNGDSNEVSININGELLAAPSGINEYVIPMSIKQNNKVVDIINNEETLVNIYPTSEESVVPTVAKATAPETVVEIVKEEKLPNVFDDVSKLEFSKSRALLNAKSAKMYSVSKNGILSEIPMVGLDRTVVLGAITDDSGKATVKTLGSGVNIVDLNTAYADSEGNKITINEYLRSLGLKKKTYYYFRFVPDKAENFEIAINEPAKTPAS